MQNLNLQLVPLYKISNIANLFGKILGPGLELDSDVLHSVIGGFFRESKKGKNTVTQRVNHETLLNEESEEFRL